MNMLESAEVKMMDLNSDNLNLDVTITETTSTAHYSF